MILSNPLPKISDFIIYTLHVESSRREHLKVQENYSLFFVQCTVGNLHALEVESDSAFAEDMPSAPGGLGKVKDHGLALMHFILFPKINAVCFKATPSLMQL